MTTGREPGGARDRVASVDALRGLAVLVLIPNLYGGFSFYEMARRYPDDPTWATLATAFTHAPWQGLTVWDMVMPTFVLLVGVSLALSVDGRRRDGVSNVALMAHVVLRGAALVVLGMLLLVQPDTLAQELIPYLLVAVGLPWSRWFDRWAGAASRVRDRVFEFVIPSAVVASIAVWLARDVERLGAYTFNQIFTQLGLAYLPAFLLMGRGLRTPLLVAATILGLWGLSFIVFVSAPSAGVAVPGDAMGGLFAHFNYGTNLAARFDEWLFAALPRSQPYQISVRGDHTLQFVPLVANMLLGVSVGRLILKKPARLAVHVAVSGLAAVVLGYLLLRLGIFPLIKNLWTPSWALISTGICLLVLAGLMFAFDRPGRAPLAFPLTALGGNAVLLYVVSSVDRWRIVLYGERLFGDVVTASPYRPVLQSLVALATLWVMALVLARLRIHIRL